MRNLWCAAALAWAVSAGAANTIDLAGDWRFALDREDAGVAGHWEDRALPDRIRIPGILNSQGYGDAISVQTPWGLSLYDKHWSLHGAASASCCTWSGPAGVPAPGSTAARSDRTCPSWRRTSTTSARSRRAGTA